MNSLQSNYINGEKSLQRQYDISNPTSLLSSYRVKVYILWNTGIHNLRKMSKLLLNLFLFLKKNRFSAEIFNSYLYFSSIGTRLCIFFFGLEISNN